MEISFKANVINKKQALFFTKKISTANSIDIICHKSADEDTVACAKAINWIATKMKKKTRILTDSTDAFRIFDDNTTIINTSNNTDIKEKADTVFCVDFSSLSRVNKNIENYIKTAKNLLCIDHHDNPDIGNSVLEIEKELSIDEINNLPISNIYVDSSSKSCSAIVLRLFQALKLEPPKKIKESLFCGIIDDLRKNRYIKYNSTLEPIKTDLFTKDKATYDLYTELEKQISQEEKNNIIKHLNVLLRLNDAQKNFQKRLSNDMRISANGKFAYTIIPPNDKEWEALGGDNPVTSSIMGNFRISRLEKSKEIDSIAVFYQDKNGYRISLHSKSGKVLDLFEHITRIHPEIQCGGHPERGGGSIQTFEERNSLDWANKIISCAEKFYSL